ncbi:MAG: hypothetical protein A2W90_20410 [Bacteroidetes bacterium GWF2_42_66]|nr:MAG: hypothetical protein A2W92_06275 [Bacteroidetes bacterium GWA2_42_15]OFX98475.1 MAG: hypothetical protein A2W89_08775 [Bacteroidetes bacterium GWE2_42_39]OFY42860.1 MAG: hypothetical protein A2W90_20410 [Bacteroidetes bacterium GWF2_42_66]HBL74489.1 hypothetical protein [Prolixibacteraceae bacterium]HCR89027.1 hypothetical protein [Prolixibacteraceae bacterium]
MDYISETELQQDSHVAISLVFLIFRKRHQPLKKVNTEPAASKFQLNFYFCSCPAWQVILTITKNNNHERKEALSFFLNNT